MQSALTPDSINRYLSRRQVMGLTGLSETTLWRTVRRGELPRPVRLTPGRVAWPEAIILAWLERRALVAPAAVRRRGPCRPDDAHGGVMNTAAKKIATNRGTPAA